MESDHRYYTRRAAEEAARARHAVTEAARARHLELASIFTGKAEQLGLHNLMAGLKALTPAPARMLVAAED